MRRKSIVGRSACRRLSAKALLEARFRYPIQAKTSKPLQPEHKLLHCLGAGSKIRAKSRSVMAPSPCGWHPHVATRRSLIASQFPLRSFALCVSTPVRVGVPAKVCLGGRLARQNCKRSLFDPKLSCIAAHSACRRVAGGICCLRVAQSPRCCCFRPSSDLALSAAGFAPLFLCVAQRKGCRGENKILEKPKAFAALLRGTFVARVFVGKRARCC